MKKAIVIASAVISIVFAVGVIIIQGKFLLDKIELLGTYSPSVEFFIEIIIALLIIPISSLVLFHIKPPKPIKILLIVVSVPIAITFIVEFGWSLFYCVKYYKEIFIFGSGGFFFQISLFMVFVAVIITCITYIRRALWPAQK